MTRRGFRPQRLLDNSGDPEPPLRLQQSGQIDDDNKLTIAASATATVAGAGKMGDRTTKALPERAN